MPDDRVLPGSPPGAFHYLALVQVTGGAALRARVPAALARGETLLRQSARVAASERGGAPLPSSAFGSLFSFDDADSALSFAASLQEALLHCDWPATLLVRPEAGVERDGEQWVYRGLRARIALHRAGAADRREVSGLADGSATYQLARIAAAAHGGQILASDALAADAQRSSGLARRDLGTHALPGVDGEVQLFEVVPPGLPERVFPQISTQTTRRSNLPAGGASTPGRHGDLGALSELLSLGVRAVRVVGRAGLGQRHLVRQFARTRTGDPRFVGGTWLASTRDGSVHALVRSVGWALGIGLDEAVSPEAAVSQIGHALAARGPLLLVVDAWAEPTPEATGALHVWLRMAPQLMVLANHSGPDRRPAEGEVLYELRPLELPTPESAKSNDAVKLFAGHARTVDEDFAVENPASLAEIVRRVGGNPTALRLLAGFVDRIPPDLQLETIVSEGAGLDDLIAGLLDLLDAQETAVLLAAAALPGSFDVSALGAEGPDPQAVIERLERRGLVRGQPDPSASQVHRYLVEERVRRLVLARLPPDEARGIADLRAHAALVDCERFARGAGRADHPEVVARIAVELEGLLQVVERGLDPSVEDASGVQLALRACLALQPVLEARGPSFLALVLSDRVLRRSDAVLGCDPLLQLRVLVMRSRALRNAGRLPAARADLERAASIAQRWSDGDGAAACRQERALVSLREGAPMDAVAELRPAVSEAGDPARHASALAVLGRASALALLHVEAERLLRSALEEQRRLGQFVDGAHTLGWLAALHEQQGALDEARARWVEAIAQYRRLGWRGWESRARTALGRIDARRDQTDLAAEQLVEAAREGRLAGDRRAEALALRVWGLVAAVDDQLEQARELLLEALAIDLDHADRAGEGADVGFVGVVAHLAAQPEAARSSYRRAIQLLGEAHHASLAAMFGGWGAALAAEEGDATARELYQTALARHAEDPDAEVAEVLHQIRGVLDLFEAAVAEHAGDRDAANRWRAIAHDRWEEARQAATPLPIVARLAHTRVGRQLGLSI